MSLRLRLRAVLCSMALLAAAPALAEPAGKLADADSLTLVAALAEADYPPFYFQEEQQLAGLSIDVLRHVSQDLGVSISYVRLSWPRVLKSLEDGQVDMVTTFSNTAARAPAVVYTGVPHAVERNHLFIAGDASIEYDGTLQSLLPYRVGAITGYSYGEAFDQFSLLNVERVLDEPTLLRMVLGQRFDAGVGNPFAIRLEAQKYGDEAKLEFLDPPINYSPIYMAFTRQHPRALELASAFTEAIVNFRRTDTYQQLLDKYGLGAPKFR